MCTQDISAHKALQSHVNLSLLESSAGSPTWQMDRPNPKRHQPDTCRPLETGPWTRSSWTSDATAHAAYAMMMRAGVNFRHLSRQD